MLSALLSVILPTFGVIGIGVLARRVGIWKQSSVDVLNKYAYYIGLPALIFVHVVSLAPAELFNTQNFVMIGGTLLIHIAVAVSMVLIGLVFKLSRDTRAVSPMLVTFGSTAYLGIPFVTYLVGGEGTAYASLLSVALVVILILFHTVILNQFDRTPSTKNKLLSLLELPFVWAVILAVGWISLNLPPLPVAVFRFLEVIAGSAGPTALLGIGAFLYGIRPFQIPWGRAVLYTMIKISVVPLLTFFALAWLGLDDVRLVVAVSLSAVSTAVTCFVLAEEHRVGIKETGGAILASTLLSLISLSVISYVWMWSSQG